MASYNPPNPYVPNAFNPNQYITPSANITTQYLDENYLRFPFAQGAENFVSINNQGQLNQGGKAEFSSATIPVNFLLAPTITNPIADTATTPANAVATIGYVLANEQGGSDLLPKNNPWTGVNNFNPTPLQTNGATMTKGLTLTNNQISVGGDGDNDIVSYTPNTTSGLCMYSLGLYDNCIGKSPQIQLFPDGVESLIQAQASNGKVVVNATGQGGSIELNASSGVKIGVNGILNFNNWGTLTGSSTTNGILSSVALNLPAQTTYNPSINYGNVASTQQFVQQALASQGSGDVTATGTNNFTGMNNFDNDNSSTITHTGLTLVGNTENYSESDIICINPTSIIGLNIYAESTSVDSTTLPKIQLYNDGLGTLFNTPIQIAQGQTGTTYNYTTLTTTNSPYVPSINFLYDSLQTLVVNQLGYFTQSYTLTASVSPYISFYYSTSIFNTTQAANALVGFTLSTTGKATFSFSPQPVNNTYSNNCAYLQLNPAVWDNGATTANMAPYFNGSANVYLLGIWNAAAILGTTTFPFINSTTLLNTHQVTFMSPVYEYNTGSRYSQNFTAQVCSFVDGYGSQNIALVVSANFPQTLNDNMVVQILPFQITF